MENDIIVLDKNDLFDSIKSISLAVDCKLCPCNIQTGTCIGNPEIVTTYECTAQLIKYIGGNI